MQIPCFLYSCETCYSVNYTSSRGFSTLVATCAVWGCHADLQFLSVYIIIAIVVRSSSSREYCLNLSPPPPHAHMHVVSITIESGMIHKGQGH